MSNFEFLPPPGGSSSSSSNRLSSLFGTGGGGGGMSDESNDPLRYAQPKKQQQQQQQLQQETQPQVLHATGATLYQFDQTQQQFVLMGKVGCAVLGTRHDSTHSYRLLCYRSSKDPVCSAQIYNDEKGGFSFTLQQGNYGTFYDDHRRLYSVLFKAPDDALHFAAYVTIAKFSAGGGQQLAHVDLQQGEGSNTIEDGCKVSVKYTGWLLIDRNEHGVPKLGKVFDSNMSSGRGYTIKVAGPEEKLAVIRGWNEGIKGMKFKNSKRFIVIPSEMAYGATGFPPEIPPNSSLCFQIEVIKAKRSGTSSETSSVPSQTPPPTLHHFNSESPSPQPPSGGIGGGIGGKEDMKKRMAKLGMPSPFHVMSEMEQGQHQHDIQPQQQPHFSEDEMFKSVEEQEPEQYQSAFTPTNSVPSNSVRNTNNYAQMNHQRQSSSSSSSHSDQSSELAKIQQQLALFQSMIQQQQPQQQPQQQQQQPQQQQQQQHITHDVDEDYTEREQQKLFFSSLEKKIFNKMNEISRKIESIDLTYLLEMRDESYSAGDSSELSAKRKKERLMSGTMLMQNIQHLVSTNETLRLDLAKEREKLDQLVEKMNELRKRNEKYADEMSERYISNSNDHDYMRKDLERTQEQLSEQKSKNTEAQMALQQQRDRNLELQEQNSRKSESNHKLEQTIQELQRQQKMQELQFREQIDELKRDHQRSQSDLMSTEKEKYLQVSEQLTSQKARCETLERQLEQLRELSSAEIAQQKQKVIESQENMRKTMEEREETLKTAFRERIMQFKQEMLEEQKDNIQSVSKLLLTRVFSGVDSSMTDKQARYRGISVQQMVASKIKMLMGALIEHTNMDDDDDNIHEFDYDEFVAHVDGVIEEAEETTLSVYLSDNDDDIDDDDDESDDNGEEHKNSSKKKKKKKTKRVTIDDTASVVSDDESLPPSAAQPIHEVPFSTTATDGGDERVLSERDHDEEDHHDDDVDDDDDDDEKMDEDRFSDGTISMTVSSTVMDPNLIHIRDDQSITTSYTLGDDEDRQPAEEEEEVEVEGDEEEEERVKEEENTQNERRNEDDNHDVLDNNTTISEQDYDGGEHFEQIDEHNVEESEDNDTLSIGEEKQEQDEEDEQVPQDISFVTQETDNQPSDEEQEEQEKQEEETKEPGEAELEKEEEIHHDEPSQEDDLDPFGVTMAHDIQDENNHHSSSSSLFESISTPTKKESNLFDDPMDSDEEDNSPKKSKKAPVVKRTSLFDDPSDDDDDDENVLAPVKATKKKSLFDSDDDDDDVFANPVSSTPSTTSLFAPRELSEEEQEELKAKKKTATASLFANNDLFDF